MDIHDFRKKKLNIINKYAPWSSYSLDHDGHKISMSRSLNDEQTVFDGIYLKTLLETANDFTGSKQWNEMEILDLGCFEAQVGIEFARQKVKKVVGIEGREANVVKANFAKEALGLDNLKIFQDDVINLSKEKYGTFDVVLCLGILYHLSAKNIFNFMEHIYETTKNIAIIDTHFATEDEIGIVCNGKRYYGLLFDENEKNVAQSALTREESFWPTKASLFRLIRDAGFFSMYTVVYPGNTYRGILHDRITVVAVKKMENKKKIILPDIYRESEDEFGEKPFFFIVHPRNLHAKNNNENK